MSKNIDVVDREFVIFALSRSGHHAIADWIYDSCSPDKAFFNFTHSNNTNPIDKRRVYYINNDKYYNHKNSLRYHNRLAKNFSLHNIQERFNFLKNNGWIFEDNKNLLVPSVMKNLVLNFENLNPEKSYKSIIKKCDKYSNVTRERIAVIVIRNPFNLLASRIMHGKPITKEERISNKINLEKFINLWKAYANIVIYNKEIRGFDKTVLVNYDEWFKSKKVKGDLSKKLKLDNVVLTSNKITFFGGGSSFDGYLFNNKAEESKPLERWKRMLSDKNIELKKKKEFIQFLKKHKEIKGISEKIFGKTVGIESIFS